MSDSSFALSHKLKTAVLFIVFNRPDTTAQVFEAIKQAKPPKLYIAADGAREDKEGEAEKVKQVREIVSKVDWDCEVKTLFRDKNLGCRIAVSSAIDWFFENEEMGIILEDDCLPEQSFFLYCQKMLEYYKEDTRIMMVTGTNLLIPTEFSKDSYFFSQHFHIWGWATWKRAWDKYDVGIQEWVRLKEVKTLDYMINDKLIRNYFEGIFDSILNDEIDTWDYQWVFACLFNNGLCIVPKDNLISNIGIDGVHFSGRTNNHFLKTTAFDLDKIKHPCLVFSQRLYEQIIYRSGPPVGIKGFLYVFLKKVKLFNMLHSIKRRVFP